MTAVSGHPTPTTHPPADLDRRFHAFALDRLLAGPLLLLVAYLAWAVSWRHGALWGGLAVLAAGALVVGAGFAVAVGLRGVTPGKAVLGLRVVDATDGRPIGVPRALLRGLVLAAAGLPTFGLGVATLAQTATLDPSRQRRGWHDRVAGSIVVDVRPVPEGPETEVEVPRQVVNLTAMRLVPAPASAAIAHSAAARRTPGDAGRTVTMTAPAGEGLDQTVVRGGAPGPGAPRWRVTVDSGESFVVEGLTLLGRRPEARPDEPVHRVVPLTSHDLSVSKTHAQVQVTSDGSLVVTDLGSTNGSILIRSGASRELPPGRPVTLLADDVVRFGDRTITVHREP